MKNTNKNQTCSTTIESIVYEKYIYEEASRVHYLIIVETGGIINLVTEFIMKI